LKRNYSLNYPVRFFIIGSLSVLFDYFIYVLLSIFITSSIAKAISFIIGSLISFFGNKYWTFKVKESFKKQIFIFYLIYFMGLLINVNFNNIFLEIFNNFNNKKISAFLISTFSSAIFNFFGMKLIVFRKK
tara:strand:- start:8217 stop:8609 length:393 start_codon:yes stop_codon:yes gene_type:complete